MATETVERASVDQSAWDGNAAMGNCSTAQDYGAICAGRKAGDPSLRSSWALPHHMRPGAPPNAAGVRNALSRLPQTQGLTNTEAAQAHLEAHMKAISAGEGTSGGSGHDSMNSAPPMEDLFRCRDHVYEVREGDDGRPRMVGYFIRYGEWTEINSRSEGHFLERIAEGAFDDSFEASKPKILFQHGEDPQIGDQVLGKIDVLRSEPEGVWVEVDLFDGIPPLVLDGLRNGAYGASMRFGVSRETYVRNPEASDYNPNAIPERTVENGRVPEFGPVTFPAYTNTSASVRSITDEMRALEFTHGDGLKLLAAVARAIHPAPAPAGEEKPPEEKPPAATPSPQATRETQEDAVEIDINRFNTVPALEARRDEVKARKAAMVAEAGVRAFDPDQEIEFDQLDEEERAISERLEYLAKRDARIADIAKRTPDPEPVENTNVYRDKAVQVPDRRVPADIYDLGAYRTASRSQEDEFNLMRDGALRSVEASEFPHPSANKEQVQAHIARLLDTVDYADPYVGKVGGELRRRILITGSPLYRKAMGKWLAAQGRMEFLAPEEQRALSLGTGSAGGFAVVYQLDPTVVPTSNFSVNPYRQIARIEQIAGTNEWKALTSGAITAAYSAEATEASDNAPTLAQPDIIVEKAQAFVPFSIELGQDWGALQNEMASLLQDAKDDLEATKFTTGAGHGSTEPKGIITAATNTVGTTTTQAFVIADLYKLLEALAPRFRPRAQFVGNLFTYDKVRQFDTAGGSGVWIDGSYSGDVRGLGPGGGGFTTGSVGMPGIPKLLGRPAWEATAMASALTTPSKILLVGDFRYFVIVDRVGMDIEIAPLLVGTNHRPTGQRGLYAYWRNSSDMLSAAAFQVLTT